MRLEDLQRAFIDYLQNGESPLQQWVEADGKPDAETRLHIYRNAYRKRLHEALATDHEMLQRYLGDQQFSQLIDDYINQQPSVWFSLRQYGDGLPDFLAADRRLAELPLVAELARFERRLLDAFDAPDSAAVGIDALRAETPESWPQKRLRFHPSVQRFETGWNTVPVWQALKQGETPPEAVAEPAIWLLWRNRERLTEFRTLAVDESAFLTDFLNGRCFAEACETLLEWHDEAGATQRAVEIIQRWVDCGLVSALV